MVRIDNKMIIIIAVAASTLVILFGTLAYLYFGTDIFKSNQELFVKYLLENVQEIDETISLNRLDALNDELEQNKHEENLIISYAEASAIKPTMELTVDTQKDPTIGKIYTKLGLSAEDFENDLELEYMQEDESYSVRFTNSVVQFFTVENNNLNQLAKNLGADESILKEIPDTIDLEKFSFKELEVSSEEKSTEINRYFQTVYNNIPKEKYQKNKNAVITLNGKTLTTTAYVLTLNSQEIKTLLIKLLETAKQDEIILSKLQILDEKLKGLHESFEEINIKEKFDEAIQERINSLNEEVAEKESNVIITVYKDSKKAVRLKLEKDLAYITIDTSDVEGKKQININHTSIDEQNTQLSNKISLVRENQNKINVQLNNVDGEEQTNINSSIEIKESEKDTEIAIIIENEENTIRINRNINMVDEIDYDVTLDRTNNMILNDLPPEQLARIMEALEGRLSKDYVEPLEPVLTPILFLVAMSGMFNF